MQGVPSAKEFDEDEALDAGQFSLFPVLEFAKQNPEMPSQQDPGLQGVFRNLLERLIASVPRLPGWYFWGHVDAANSWQTDYVGKAENLWQRLFDELREEAPL